MSTATAQFSLFPTPRRSVRADITRGRHRGNAMSEAANEAIAPHKKKLRKLVEEFFLLRGARGATTFEVKNALHIPYTTASARISELKMVDKVLVYTDMRRPTENASAAVLIHKSFVQKADPQ